MIIDRADFAAALARAASATASRTPLDITRHIRLEIRDGTLVATGTNLAVTVEMTVPAKGTLKPVLVPAAIARQVAALTSATVEFAVKSDRATIAGDATFRMPTYPVADWPDIRPPTDGTFVPERGFDERFEAVATHAATNRVRPILAAVMISDGTLAATDSYRAAIVDEAIPVAAPLLVPAVKLGGPVDRVDYDTRHVMFTTADGRILARLVDGAFPNVRKIIPTAGVVAQVAGGDLVSACARAGIISHEPGVTLEQVDSGLRVSVAGDNEFEQVIPATFDGDMPTTAVRPEFLRDALAPISGTVDLLVQVNGKSPISVSHGWWRSVIMPVMWGRRTDTHSGRGMG